jgi:hypothetical protein
VLYTSSIECFTFDASPSAPSNIFRFIFSKESE